MKGRRDRRERLIQMKLLPTCSRSKLTEARGCICRHQMECGEMRMTCDFGELSAEGIDGQDARNVFIHSACPVFQAQSSIRCRDIQSPPLPRYPISFRPNTPSRSGIERGGKRLIRSSFFMMRAGETVTSKCCRLNWLEHLVPSSSVQLSVACQSRMAPSDGGALISSRREQKLTCTLYRKFQTLYKELNNENKAINVQPPTSSKYLLRLYPTTIERDALLEAAEVDYQYK